MLKPPLSNHSLFDLMFKFIINFSVFGASLSYFNLVPFLSFPLQHTLVAMGTISLILGAESREIYREKRGRKI